MIDEDSSSETSETSPKPTPVQPVCPWIAAQIEAALSQVSAQMRVFEDQVKKVQAELQQLRDRPTVAKSPDPELTMDIYCSPGYDADDQDCCADATYLVVHAPPHLYQRANTLSRITDFPSRYAPKRILSLQTTDSVRLMDAYQMLHRHNLSECSIDNSFHLANAYTEQLLIKHLTQLRDQMENRPEPADAIRGDSPKSE